MGVTSSSQIDKNNIIFKVLEFYFVHYYFKQLT